MMRKVFFRTIAVVFFRTIAVVFFLAPVYSWGQESFVISGYIKDDANHEPLLYSNVAVKGKSLGVSANDYGFFSFKLPKGKHTLVFSYLGYKNNVIEITLNEDLRKDFFLIPESTQLEEIILVDERVEDKNVKGVQTSVVTLKMAEVNAIPVVFGEKDILKTLQYIPGVAAAGDGSANFLVRGGTSDQNLVLLDEAPVYNTSHLLGFFSTFNSDVVKDLQLMKGQYPAEFGGRLSSLLNIKMKEGNARKVSGQGGIGLISSRLTMEIPIIEEKSSFLIAGRRTYADILVRLFGGEDTRNLSLYFYDVNMKYNWEINDFNKIFISGFFGRDVFGGLGGGSNNNSSNIGIDFSNTTLTGLWNHIFTPSLFVNTSLLYSLYAFNFEFGTGKLETDIQDVTLKQTYSYYFGPGSKLKFGFDAIYHTYTPSKLQTESQDRTIKFYSMEHGVFASHSYDVSSRLKAVYGLRYTGFSLLGPSPNNIFDEAGNIAKVENTKDNEVIKYYDFWEPRISMNYLINDQNSIKIGVARNAQYLHVVTSSNSGGTPIDTYMPSTKTLKPQKSHQASLGYFFNVLENSYEFSVEVYGKEMWDISDYKENADPFVKEGIEGKLTLGRGVSYGVELFAKKRKGDLIWWVSYTLSKTESFFSEINGGKPFLAPQDRTHNLSAVLTYNLGKWTLSSAFSLVSGRPTTYPAGRYVDVSTGSPVTYYDGRNTYRWPASHRLDVGATYRMDPSVYFGKKFSSELVISVYNIYNQKNPYSIYSTVNKGGKYTLEKLSLFGILPTVTWNFKF